MESKKTKKYTFNLSDSFPLVTQVLFVVLNRPQRPLIGPGQGLNLFTDQPVQIFPSLCHFSVQDQLEPGVGFEVVGELHYL